jgi:molybdate transport system substrate-binding protein
MMKRFMSLMVIGLWMSSMAQSLTIFAASSLTDVFLEIEPIFEARYQVDVAFNFGASSTLVTQIIEGAPADIFASADLANMLKVVSEDTFKVFAKNKLVVISSTPDIQTLEDLQSDYLLVLTGEEVPVGKYARTILANLNQLYGADYAGKVLSNLVSNEANVRQALSKVVLGEADVSMVYVTDVQSLEGLQVIDIPDAYNVVADYPIAVLPESKNQALAKAFIDFLLSSEGQEVLERYRFILPE